jgi:hypothetical protein
MVVVSLHRIQSNCWGTSGLGIRSLGNCTSVVLNNIPSWHHPEQNLDPKMCVFVVARGSRTPTKCGFVV